MYNTRWEAVGRAREMAGHGRWVEQMSYREEEIGRHTEEKERWDRKNIYTTGQICGF